MRTHFPNDPSGLRAKAEFFQRLARMSHSISSREELEELSFKSMEEATTLERELADLAAPVEFARWTIKPEHGDRRAFE